MKPNESDSEAEDASEIISISVLECWHHLNLGSIFDFHLSRALSLILPCLHSCSNKLISLYTLMLGNASDLVENGLALKIASKRFPSVLLSMALFVITKL